MAQLDVQPKRSNPWWIWLLLAIIAIAILLFLFRGCNHNSTQVATTTDSTHTTDSTKKPVAAITQPDWNGVDFNSPKSADPNINDKDIMVSGSDKYTIYTLGENILFATGQNTLQGNAGQKLNIIAASINKRFKGASIGVYGNTDSTGTAGSNKQLGAQRAAAVRNWLIKSGGIDSAKISIHSLGASKPVATNATASGRQQNRNVEIVAFPDSTAH